MAPKSRAETKAETREALLLAALQMFSEQGLEGPSLDNICARAGFTRGAFYVHFATRDDLKFAVIERVLTAWTDVIADSTDDAGGDLGRTLDRFVETFARTLVDPLADPYLSLGTANLHLVLSAAQRDPKVGRDLSALLQREADRLAVVVRAAQAAGTVRTDIAARTLSDLLITLVIGALAMIPVGYPPDMVTLRDAILALLVPQHPG